MRLLHQLIGNIWAVKMTSFIENMLETYRISILGSYKLQKYNFELIKKGGRDFKLENAETSHFPQHRKVKKNSEQKKT